MLYALCCRLEGNVEKYHHKIVNEITKKFGANITKTKDIPAHFTLKFPFETENIKEIEKILKAFCKTHKKTTVTVGGFGGFYPSIIFITVRLSREAKQTFFELISALRKVERMQWDKFDAEKMRFHATVAEECGDKFSDIRQFVKSKEQHFNCWFDNITIIESVSGNREFEKWKIDKCYRME